MDARHESVNPSNTKSIYIRPTEMLQSNQGRMRSCAKLSGQPDAKLMTAIQAPKTYIYPLFCVLSTITTASAN